MTKKINLTFVFPVLMSFFVMSFCDLVGIGVDRIKLGDNGRRRHFRRYHDG